MIVEGIGVSIGISIGRVFKIENAKLEISPNLIENVDDEINKFHRVVKDVIKDLQELRNKTAKEIDESHAKIFDAHIEFADDPELLEQVEDLIKEKKYNSAYALKEVSESFIELFNSMDDEYLKDRVNDFKDVINKITSYLLGYNNSNIKSINKRVIIVANDLSPSDLAQINKENVVGIITGTGSRTSHIAIMSRSLKIPSIIGVKGIINKVKNNDLIIIDGSKGIIVINPSKKEEEIYIKRKIEYEKKEQIKTTFANKKTLTKDKKHIEIAANIGKVSDLEEAVKVGAEGIGLFRTEFLYMNSSDFPSEEDQYQSYKIVLETMKDKKVVIRTLDIGGDKALKYLKFKKELNPSLGNRAIRYSFSNISIFKTQLRALIRASEYGNLHIMFPMIATIEELKKAKRILKECEKELIKENAIIKPEYKVGMMIEIPSAAILADRFAKEVDFFSIGTNDLIQYTFAADRTNESVSYLYQPLNTSMIRLIKYVVESGHKENIWVGVCGEMASCEKSAPILLGLGVDELSMNSSSILTIRHLMSELTYKRLKKIANDY